MNGRNRSALKRHARTIALCVVATLLAASAVLAGSVISPRTRSVAAEPCFSLPMGGCIPLNIPSPSPTLAAPTQTPILSNCLPQCLHLVTPTPSATQTGGGGSVSGKAPAAFLSVLGASSLAAGQQVTFAATASTENTGATIANYAFAFGDGGGNSSSTNSPASAAFNVNHTYTAAGSYTVTFKVQDSTGESATTSINIMVAAASGGGSQGGGSQGGGGLQAPLVTVSVSSANPTAGQPVTFTASATTANSGATISGFQFSFGDGNASSPVLPSGSPSPSATVTAMNTYTASGNYTVTVQALDSSNQSGSATTTITVSSGSGSSADATPGGNNASGGGNAGSTGGVASAADAATAGSSAAGPMAGPTSVAYASGWNLVAGPSSFALPDATAPYFTYQTNDSNYETIPDPSGFTGGLGYWAFFPNAAVEMLPAGNTNGPIIPLGAGQWTLIGNSGTTPAGVTGADVVYVYTAATGYAPASSLSPGQGAWAYSANGGTATITSGPGP
jgi:PKD repeat protein